MFNLWSFVNNRKGQIVGHLFRCYTRGAPTFLNKVQRKHLSTTAPSSFSLLSPFQLTSSPLKNLRKPSKDDIDTFRQLLGNREESVVTDENELKAFNNDWTGRFNGQSQVVLKPKTKEEISAILSFCNREKIGVVPQAGNTGLVGGSTPICDEVILSINQLDTVDSFDETDGILTCGAGCILENLQNFVKERNHLLPVDFGAKGTCRIGGNLSTNAGGSYYYRFGSMHANILGLEVVLPDGTVLDLMNSNRKDNTGYDLKHLFIGAEGTLGIVTKLVLSCPSLPKTRNTVFLACDNFENVQETMKLAKQDLGETLAAFEFMDNGILNLLQKNSSLKIPVQKDNTDGQNENNNYPFCVLVESQGSNDEHDSAKMDSFLSKCMERELILDGTMAQDIKQVNEMWSVREHCNPVTKNEGYNYKYDVSLPIPQYYSFVEEMRQRICQKRPDVKDVNWGHVIDGNLHFNVTTPGNFKHDPEVQNLLEPYIFETVARRNGSISAEHGLGRCKNQYMGKFAKNAAAVEIMKNLKKMFDPNNILNPGKYLPNDQNDSDNC